jgi:uncharacterized protein YhaN
MKLRSLRLKHYGHIDELQVDFGEAATIVLGPNEAGKSTILDAISDFLWGVRTSKHPRAFVYAPKGMELQGSVEIDGESVWYMRHLKTLSRAGKDVVAPWDPDARGGAEAWRGVFGLNLEQLKQGGRSVIDGAGDLSDLVFLAETGRMVKAVRNELAERLDDVFKDRKNSSCEIRAAINHIETLEADLERGEASAADVSALRESIEQREKLRGQVDAEVQAASKRQRRLGELLRCLPIAAELREYEKERDGLFASGICLNQADTAALQAALEGEATAADNRAKHLGAIQLLETRRAELNLNPQILAARDGITALVQELSARRDDRAVCADTDALEARREAVVRILPKLGLDPASDMAGSVRAVSLADATRDGVRRQADEVSSAAARLKEQQGAISALEQQAAESDVEIAHGGDALLAARSARDAVWQEVRGPWISGDLPGAQVRRDLAESLDRHLEEADETAERMAEELEAAAHQRGEAAARAKQLASAVEACERLQRAHAESVEQWSRLAVECRLPGGTDPAAWKIHDDLLTQLNEAWNALRATEKAIAAAQVRWDRFVGQVEALNGLPGSAAADPLVRLQALSDALAEAMKAESKAEEIDRELSSTRIQLHESEVALAAHESRIGELVTSGEQPADMLVRSKARLVAEAEMEAAIVSLKRSRDPGSSLDALLAELVEWDREALEAALDEAGVLQRNLSDQLSEIDETLGVDRKELSDLESRDSVAVLRAAEVAAGERLLELVHEYRSLRVQIELLDLLAEELARSSASPMLDRAGIYLAKLTEGRCAGFRVVDQGADRHLEVLHREAGDGESEPVQTTLSSLSDGTADQVFLALRLAGIYSRQEQRKRDGLPPLPVVLDDVLVAHDDDRTAAALKVIGELGRSMQVIVMTHHRHVRDAAQAIEGVACVEL